MNFAFSNILGAPYRGGNLVICENELLAAAGNKISQVDLKTSVGSALPFESLKQIQTLCVSPDGGLLVVVDCDGGVMVVSRRRRVLLHRLRFKSPAAAARFSPDARFLAVAVGRLLQVWIAPGYQKAVAPLQLHRTYGSCHADITHIDWSDDGRWIAVASKDLTARVFSVDTLKGYKPPTLAGHKDTLLAAFFATHAMQQSVDIIDKPRADLYTVSRDGALFAWSFTAAAADDAHPHDAVNGDVADEHEDDDDAAFVDRASKRRRVDGSASSQRGSDYSEGTWQLADKFFFNRASARVSAVDLHKATGVMVVGYTTGMFDIYQLPDCTNIHSLSISRERITSAVFNAAGDWIALGCAKLGQLLVWEWRSETYVLKQQGHYFDVAATAFSPDGSLLVSGADDNKVKVWNTTSGFCFVTFSEHTAPVTAVQFLPSSGAVLSASLDGTVRAFDLIRYRNFRTFTSPTPVQFVSLAVDDSGEVVCAGTMDTFQIFVWSVKTARLLDVLAAHEGPVVALAFCPTQPLLASASWDATVRTWDVFGGKGGIEVLQHSNDVLACAFSPNGKQLACSTLDGQIWFWDPHEAALQGTIEGRRDIKGGRLMSDRRAAGNLASGACFTSLVYSADGTFLLAAGNSKFVCMYDVTERIMLRRFQISQNRSLDGVLDVLNSKNLTDAGPLDLIDGDDDGDVELLQPTVGAGAHGVSDLPGAGGKRKALVRTRHLALSPTGRMFSAATTEGILLYSVDDVLLFDPTDLAEDVTPQAARQALQEGLHLKALLIALRLKDAALTQHVICATPPSSIVSTIQNLPVPVVGQVMEALADLMHQSPHLEHLLLWMKTLGTQHGAALHAMSSRIMPALRSVQQVVNKVHDDLSTACEHNMYTLEYLTNAPRTEAID